MNFLPKQGKNVITLSWKNEVMNPVSMKETDVARCDQTSEKIVNNMRTSTRQRKAPVTRSSDFYGESINEV
jgi:hypothetical protein